MKPSMQIEGSIGIVHLDNPPVNAIGQPARAALLDFVRQAEAAGLERVVVTGRGRAFAAGADAREFDGDPLEPHLPDVLNAVEASPVPWIAAINGVALGGGLEIALACRYRIAAPSAQLGMPEVNLGVIPGAGGTQRLPRLIGLKTALGMISVGRPVSAAQGLTSGLVDAIADDPVEQAKTLPLETLTARPRLTEMPAPAVDGASIQAARDQAARKMRGHNAPQRAIDVIETGLGLPVDEALQIERTTFLELRVSGQARALRHMFFAERGAKAPAHLPPARELGKTAVIGGGTMGSGIAYALINAGLSVTLVEMDAEGAERARQNVEKLIGASLMRGLIDEAGAEARRDRISFVAGYEGTADAALVIEAAFESMDVKVSIFTQLERHAPKDAVLASNTSYLDIDELADRLENPARVLGLHFFAPAHIMKLLEIVKGKDTSDTALATGFALGKRLRKIPVLAGVCDGFIGNRILARYREAADTVMADGSTPWDIDAAMMDFGYAMGVYEAQDMSGLDIAFANRRRQDATRDPNRRYVAIGDRMVEAGRLGRKTGAGWYDYSSGTKATDPAVMEIVKAEPGWGQAGTLKGPEIANRLLLAMINEAADILHEGIAQSAADIDLVTVFGYGFPRWRGGLMHYADTLGVPGIVKQIESLAKADPVVWALSPALRACLEKGIALKDYRRGAG